MPRDACDVYRRATTAEEFAAQYESAMKHRGPRLIEAMI
jgi:acetolactate synthase I/II/III large subunit